MTTFNLDTQTLDLIHRRLTHRYEGADVVVISVQGMPSHFGRTPEIRVAYRIAGIEERRTVQMSLDDVIGMRLVNDDIYVFIVRELIRVIEEDRREIMAQWNQRRTQQLQAQERQRREARGQEEPEPQRITFRAHSQRAEGTRISDIHEAQQLANTEYLRRWFRDDIENNGMVTNDTGRGGAGGTPIFTTNTISTNATQFMYTTTNGIGAAGGGAGGTVYAKDPVLTFDAAEEMFKRLLQEKLESLDIRISLDESDGEVTAEVEVILDGKVITSDSDTITLG